MTDFNCLISHHIFKSMILFVILHQELSNLLRDNSQQHLFAEKKCHRSGAFLVAHNTLSAMLAFPTSPEQRNSASSSRQQSPFMQRKRQDGLLACRNMALHHGPGKQKQIQNVFVFVFHDHCHLAQRRETAMLILSGALVMPRLLVCLSGANLQRE